MGETDTEVAVFYDTLETTAINKPFPDVIKLDNIVILSKEDYDFLIECKDAARMMAETGNMLLETWLSGYTWCSSMPLVKGYRIAFKEMTKKLNKLNKSWFYRIWRKLHK